MLRFKEEIASLLAPLIGWEEKEVFLLLEIPPDSEFGDYSFPCFPLARELRQAPARIAAELSNKLQGKGRFLKKVEGKGPYLNFYVDEQTLAERIVAEILNEKGDFGRSSAGSSEVVVIDYSAPNIAKPFGIGHLRSTVIGDALYRIYSALGYRCIGINHLGDWGTQFGKLIVAYKHWGEGKGLQDDPVRYLYELYVLFHREAEDKPELEEEARFWFKKLEDGDAEALTLWQRFRELSLAEFKRVYEYLGVNFDYYYGESFYNDRLDATLEMVQQKNIARESEGALVVDLEQFGLPPCLLRKKDGATLYATRDLAAAIYRYEEYRFSQMLYVVGAEQKLHFQQLFSILKLMGYPWAKKCKHIPFGLIRFPGGRMSTRQGKTIFLEDVVNRAVELAEKIIAEKNPDLENRKEVAKIVGVGAIKFGDLSNDRIKDIDFDWEKILDFSGETAPYIQYSHARIFSILRKSGGVLASAELRIITEEERSLVKTLGFYAESIERAAEAYKPSILARYLINLAKDFNRFYHNCSVLGAEESLRQSRLLLCAATKQVLANGLDLLGIGAPEEM
ncbi:MAG: arginine--tRNA ligase [Dethiobacteria bacterium]|jgi:arginyl-tRNA synthetase